MLNHISVTPCRAVPEPSPSTCLGFTPVVRAYRVPVSSRWRTKDTNSSTKREYTPSASEPTPRRLTPGGSLQSISRLVSTPDLEHALLIVSSSTDLPESFSRAWLASDTLSVSSPSSSPLLNAFLMASSDAWSRGRDGIFSLVWLGEQSGRYLPCSQSVLLVSVTMLLWLTGEPNC